MCELFVRIVAMALDADLAGVADDRWTAGTLRMLLDAGTGASLQIKAWLPARALY